MIFMSITIPINQINNQCDAEMDGWFLFHSIIRNKNEKYDEELHKMKNRIDYARYFINMPLYCYLIASNYFYKSKLRYIFENLHSCFCMDNMPDDYIDCFRHPEKYRILSEKEQIYSKEDIRHMFEIFRCHNFRNNPICEVILGKSLCATKEDIVG